MGVGKKAAAVLAASALALAATIAVADGASAYSSIACGSTGTAKLGVIVDGSYFKTKLANDKTGILERADIEWKVPLETATAAWYNGTAVTTPIVYSPGVSTTNFPSRMRGNLASGTCSSTVAAANY